ncbi:DUF6176 family protein [Amycolatopsis sp. NPDC049253]|jgi:hypothetical protein|uniref:DUF6176 family protein n=1 Tax=Amycolatopsis sp. NPDC049253 TaxID=3155274 RepID=UPI00341E6B8D
MINIRVSRISPEKVELLRSWLAEAGERAAEVKATLVDEGVRHERALLVDTSDGPLLIYAVECDDIEAALAVFAKSAHPIDAEHKRVMAEVGGTPVAVEELFDVRL